MIYQLSNDPPFIFWGMANEFSRLVLQSLVRNGMRPSSVFLPGSTIDGINRIVPTKLSTSLPIKNPFMHESIAQTAWNHELPLFEVSDLTHEAVVETIKDLKPTAALVACFPKRIPRKILDLPKLGFINLHPSLLPSLRGPYPLFWTFRLGHQPGITLHLMDEGLDTGDILAQTAVEFPSGINGSEADQIMAEEGAKLINSIYPDIKMGRLKRKPQKGAASTYSAPAAKDFIIPTNWPAARAFNFIRGTAEWNHPFIVNGTNFQIAIRMAIDFNPHGEINKPYKKERNNILIQFNPGILHARK